MLVPLAQMVAAGSGWEKQPTPPSGLKPYLVQGCAEASTNFAEIGALPDEYEVIVACPTAGDITKLWARIDWSNMLLGKWTVASSAFGTYGQQSRTYVKHYVYDSDGNACWAYLSLMTVHNALAIAGLCDYDDQALAQTRSEAQTWDYTVVQRILSVQGWANAPLTPPQVLSAGVGASCGARRPLARPRRGPRCDRTSRV